MTSGWCSAPTGARPQHERCRSTRCGCECHGSPVVERDSACGVPTGGIVVRYDMGTSKDGPERGVCTSGRGLADDWSID